MTGAPNAERSAADEAEHQARVTWTREQADDLGLAALRRAALDMLTSHAPCLDVLSVPVTLSVEPDPWDGFSGVATVRCADPRCAARRPA